LDGDASHHHGRHLFDHCRIESNTFHFDQLIWLPSELSVPSTKQAVGGDGAGLGAISLGKPLAEEFLSSTHGQLRWSGGDTIGFDIPMASKQAPCGIADSKNFAGPFEFHTLSECERMDV